MSFHNDETRLSLEEAEKALLSYIEEYRGRCATVTVLAVLRHVGAENTHHNRARLIEVMDYHLERLRMGQRLQYKMADRLEVKIGETDKGAVDERYGNVPTSYLPRDVREGPR